LLTNQLNSGSGKEGKITWLKDVQDLSNVVGGKTQAPTLEAKDLKQYHFVKTPLSTLYDNSVSIKDLKHKIVHLFGPPFDIMHKLLSVKCSNLL